MPALALPSLHWHLHPHPRMEVVTVALCHEVAPLPPGAGWGEHTLPLPTHAGRLRVTKQTLLSLFAPTLPVETACTSLCRKLAMLNHLVIHQIIFVY